MGNMIKVSSVPNPQGSLSYRGASHNNSYAIFGGGIDGYGNGTTYVTAYNSSLTNTNKSLTSSSNKHPSATHVGNYVLFGPYNTGQYDAFDNSLTRTNPVTAGNLYYEGAAATHVGDYAIFAGGGTDFSTKVTAYNSSLTRTIPDNLSAGRYGGYGTHVGNYALIISSQESSNVKNGKIVDAYDTSLTHTVPTALTNNKSMGAATHLGDYALVGGGSDNNSIIVETYNTSLTHSTATDLFAGVYFLGATHIDDICAIFAGGYGINGSQRSEVNVYNSSLVRSTGPDMSYGGTGTSGTHIGQYALLANGNYNYIINGYYYIPYTLWEMSKIIIPIFD